MENVVVENKKTKKFELYLIVLLFLCYAFAYIGRISYSSNIVSIIDAFNVSKKDTGIVTTCYFIAYGAFTIVNGFLVRKYNKKIVIPIVLTISSLSNLLIFLGIDFSYYKYLWFINGVCQSFLWVTISDVTSRYISKNSLDKALTIVAMSCGVGTLSTYLLSSLLIKLECYQIIFLIAFILMIIIAIIWLFSYRYITTNLKENRDKITGEKIRLRDNPSIFKWFFFEASVFVVFAIAASFIKDGLGTWVPSILKDTYNTSNSLSVFLSVFLPIATMFAPLIYNLLFRKNKNYIILLTVLSLIIMVLIIASILLLNTPLYIVLIIVFIFINLINYMINHLITTVFPVNMRKYAPSGLVTGILNGSCYVGSALSSYALGAVSDSLGWIVVFNIFIVCSAVLLVVGIIYFIVSKKKKMNIDE